MKNKFKLTLEEGIDKVEFVVFQFDERNDAIEFLLDPTTKDLAKKITLNKNEIIELSFISSEFIYDASGACASISLCRITKIVEVGLHKFVYMYVCWIPSTQLKLVEHKTDQYCLKTISKDEEQINDDLFFTLELA